MQANHILDAWKMLINSYTFLKTFLKLTPRAIHTHTHAYRGTCHPNKITYTTVCHTHAPIFGTMMFYERCGLFFDEMCKQTM